MAKIRIAEPHDNQLLILKSEKRFNHVRCGRRFGKTSAIVYLLIPSLLENWKIGIWFPTYKDLFKIWRAVLVTFYEAIKDKDETTKHIDLKNGGEIDFWSMHNPDLGRGNSYHRAIIDEAAIARHLDIAWKDTIRPTLTDFAGDAYFFSTPQGKANYFYLLEDSMKNQPNWSFFHFTSYENPFLDTSEIDAAKNQLDELSFRQEYLAEYVDLNDKPFLYVFNEKRHVNGEYEPNPNLELWISFDFNVNPMSCIVAQQTSIIDLIIFDEIQLNNAGTKELCDRILAKYPKFYYIVTGDASGSSRTTTAGASVTDWKIIMNTLLLNNQQKKVRKANLGLNESQTLCNSVLQNANVRITHNCTALAYDLGHAIVDEMGKLAKEMSQTGLHLFDCWRYLIDAVYPDFIKNYRKYQGWN
jgi:hypothetical protein